MYYHYIFYWGRDYSKYWFLKNSTSSHATILWYIRMLFTNSLGYFLPLFLLKTNIWIIRSWFGWFFYCKGCNGSTMTNKTKPRILCNGNGAISRLQTETGFVEDFRYSLYNWLKYIFCPIWNLLCENRNLKRNFENSHIQNLNGVLLIFKLPFPNGSYRNGVFRALWAICPILPLPYFSASSH